MNRPPNSKVNLDRAIQRLYGTGARFVECRSIIANRQRQTWPTMVAKGEGWDELYAAAKGELPVRVTVDEAIEWVNELISRIDAAR